MQLQPKSFRMERSKHLETCLVIAGGLLVFWLIYGATWLVWAALSVCVVGAFLPSVAAGLHWAWFKLAEGLGWVMSRVILSIVFFGVLTVVAFVYRLFHTDKLQLKRKAEGSYWSERNHAYSPEDLEKPW